MTKQIATLFLIFLATASVTYGAPRSVGTNINPPCKTVIKNRASSPPGKETTGVGSRVICSPFQLPGEGLPPFTPPAEPAFYRYGPGEEPAKPKPIIAFRIPAEKPNAADDAWAALIRHQAQSNIRSGTYHHNLQSHGGAGA